MKNWMERIPLDRRVWPGFWILLVVLCVSVFFLHHPILSVFLLLFLSGHMLFFRNPRRTCQDPAAIISPASGQLVDISVVEEPRYLKGKAVRLAIFLSIFDVHVTRASMEGIVDYLDYRPGKFLNAIRKESGEMNESNWIGLKARQDSPRHLMIRQIAGAIARRIRCDVRSGQAVAQGENLGIICYGSRVEVYIPENLCEVALATGTKVKAGETVLATWKA